MEKIKRMIMCSVPTSICNFRCHYCYVNRHVLAYRGKQPDFIYTPQHVGEAFSKERMGGICFFNFCANGETLLTKEIDKYIYEVVKKGHYVEIVTNMVITPMIDKILSWGSDILSHVEFKCSFHYLELRKKNLLDVFANNIKAAWEAGASASIELMPSDELIPYIDEVKAFSMEHFKALPQLTVARNDASAKLEYLTKLTPQEYSNIWSVFDSPMFQFKHSIFKVKRSEYCYSGMYTLFVNLASGKAKQCYISNYSQNIFADLNKPVKFIPIGRCRQPHCFNGHALLSFGNIPGAFVDVQYGTSIRDRVMTDGTHWLKPELLEFFNSRLDENNVKITKSEKQKYYRINFLCAIPRLPIEVVRKMNRFSPLLKAKELLRNVRSDNKGCGCPVDGQHSD